MRGQLLGFNEEKQAGAIAASNGQRYIFHISDWQDVLPPERGMSVDFTPGEGTRAHQVQIAAPAVLPDPLFDPLPPPPLQAQPAGTASAPQPPAPMSLALRPKRKAVLTLLTLFLGFLGAHRFYMGAWGLGLVQLLAVPLVIGVLALALPPLGGLLYLIALIFIWVELVRYIWMSDAEFDTRVQHYQAARPGPFSFFW